MHELSLGVRSCFTALVLTPCQKNASALHGPVKLFQPKGQLVAHPVGAMTSNWRLPRRRVGTAREASSAGAHKGAGERGRRGGT